MASGVPVVATRVGGNPELIDSATAGALVPVEDTDALATALGSYLDNPERLAWERAAVRARAVEWFGIDAMVASYLALYERLLMPAPARAVDTERTAS